MALTGSTIASTYLKLLRINSDTMGADATASYIQDSADTDSALSISTTRVGIGNAAPASVLHLTGTMQVGVDGTGHDVIFYGDTPSSNMTWDESEDDLVLNDSRLLIDQDDTVIALEIDTESATTDAMKFTGPATTTGNIININAADALTTGAALSIDCGSANLASTVSGGLVEIMQDANSAAVVNNLLFVKNDHASATGTTGIYVQQDSTGPAISTTGGIVEQGGTLKENLITNSGFDVWSNSTPETVSTPVEDDMADDDTGDWTSIDSTLAFDAVNNHYEITYVAGSQRQHRTITALTAGKLYKLTLDIKDGTRSGESVQVFMSSNLTGDNANSMASGTTTGSWASITVVFEAASTDDTVIIDTYMSGSGNVEIRNFALYEVTPGCVAADSKAMDGWYKDNDQDLWRQHNDGGTLTKDGSFYSLKVYATGGSGHEVLWPSSDVTTSLVHCQRFAGRTVTFGCWMKSDAATIVKVADNAATTQDTHSGGNAWEWIEVTHTVTASPTAFKVLFRAAGTDTYYISQPMLVFGSSIGEGNYTRPQGEIVWFESQSGSNSMQATTGYSTGGWTTINLEADNNGKIPKGIKAAYIKTIVNDSASASTAACRLIVSKDSVHQTLENSVQGLANDFKSHMVGWINCNSDGDVVRYIFASGSGTFDISEFVVNAVQLR